MPILNHQEEHVEGEGMRASKNGRRQPASEGMLVKKMPQVGACSMHDSSFGDGARAFTPLESDHPLGSEELGLSIDLDSISETALEAIRGLL